MPFRPRFGRRRTPAGATSYGLRSSHPPATPFHRSLRFEPLEERRLLAITVNTLSDVTNPGDGLTTIREAIAAAAPGETIDFSVTGTIQLAQANGQLVINKHLTLDGPGAELLTVDAGHGTDGQHATGDGFRAFLIQDNTIRLHVELNGLTITGGDVAGSTGGGGVASFEDVTLDGVVVINNAAPSNNGRGGGIVHDVGNLTVRNGVVTDNFSRQGGGLYVADGTALVEGSTFDFNTATTEGGGIRLASGSLTISSSTFDYNDATNGAAIYGAGELSITNTNLMRNTAGHHGGAIYSSGVVTILDSDLWNNYAGNGGGGIRHVGADLEIERSIIRENGSSGGGSGGGIHSSSVVRVTDSSIVDNYIGGSNSGGGGGIFCSSAMTITRSTVARNRTENDFADGGGIHALSNVTIRDSTIADNRTLGDGAQAGGVLCEGSLLLVEASTISRNRTDGEAAHIGGLGCFGALTIRNSTISGNVAGGTRSVAGGTANDGYLRVYYSTIVNNYADDAGAATPGGGGIRKLAGGMRIQGSIIAGNVVSSLTAPDIRTGSATLDIDFSLIGSTAGSGITAATGTGNVLNQNPLIGPLANNGGRTLTHALRDGSPAIDMGVFTSPPLHPNDQRGAPFDRVVNGDGVGGARMDIGAYERQTLPGLSLVVDTLVDEMDGDYAAGDLSLREAIGLANGSIDAHTVTFATSLTSGGPATILLTKGELEINESLALTGPGANLLKIDAQQQSRVINISATTGDFSISGLTLTGGKTTGGDGQAIITTHSGGGVRSVTNGNLTIDKTVIAGNSTTGYFTKGGGVFATGPLTISNSTISGNSTAGHLGRGGGICCTANDLKLIQSTVSGNTTSGINARGGGIYARNMILTESTVSGNSTSGQYAHGGGFHASGVVTLYQSTLSGNTTTGASAHGGGIKALDNVVMIHSTVAGNQAMSPTSIGGGVHTNDFILIYGSMVAKNLAGGGNPDLSLAAGGIDVAYSLIGDRQGTSLSESQTPDANGNLVGNSMGAGVIDPLLGALVDNGGPTMTHALLAGSPAIDWGDPAFDPDDYDPPLDHDQRGAPFVRVFDGNGAGGARVDIGAFELQAVVQPPALLGDYNQNGTVDAADYVVWRNTLTNNVAPFSGADGDGDGVVDQGDYGVWRANFGRVAGAGADLNVQGGGLNIADGDTTPTAGDGTHFGEVDVPGGGPATHSFVIQNTGTGTLTLNGPAPVAVVGADFSVTLQPALLTLAPSQSTSFDVRFAPTAVGLRQATVQIASSDVDENPYDFVISGVGRQMSTGSGQVFLVATEVGGPSGPDSHIYRFDRDGTDDGQFFGNAILSSIATNGTHLFVADAATNTIKRFSPAGAFLGDFAVVTGESEDFPIDIEFDDSGSLYVAMNRQIAFRYNASGTQAASFSHSLLDETAGIDGDASGNVWIASFVNDAPLLLKFTANGSFLGGFSIANDVLHPADLAIDETAGMLYIADEFDNDFGVKSFDISTGTPSFVAKIPTPESVSGLSFDPISGNLLIVDLGGDADSAEITTSGNIVNTFVLGPDVLAADIVALPEGSAAAGTGHSAARQERTIGIETAPLVAGVPPANIRQAQSSEPGGGGVLRTPNSRLDLRPSGPRHDAAAMSFAARRDDALVAWVARRAVGDDADERIESGNFADDLSAKESAASFCDTVDTVFERLRAPF